MKYPASGSDDRQTHADTDARAILIGRRLALGHYNLAKLECNVLHELPMRSHAVETAAGFYDLLTVTDAIFTSQRPADDAEEHWTSMSMDELDDLGLGGLSALIAAMREFLVLAKPLHSQRGKLQLVSPVSQEVLAPGRFSVEKQIMDTRAKAQKASRLPFAVIPVREMFQSFYSHPRCLQLFMCSLVVAQDPQQRSIEFGQHDGGCCASS